MTTINPNHAAGAERAGPPAKKKGFNPKQFFINLSLVLGALTVLFIVAEIGLRALGIEPKTATALNSYFQYDAETGWNGRPNAEMRFATTAFAGYTSHGEDGFRIIAKDPKGAEDVVWCVGDSGTWGWGVSDGETYVDRLNELSDEKTVFRNLGVCGFSTAQQYLLIRDLLAKHPDDKPGTVVLLFCQNDLPENVDWKDQTPPRPYYSVEAGEVTLNNYPAPVSSMSIRSWLKRNSLAYNHLNFYLIMAKRTLKNRKMTGNTSAPPQSPEEQWVVLKHGYRQIRDLCAKRGIAFVPVYLPPYALRHGSDTSPEQRAYDDALRSQFTEMAQGLSLRVLDISDDIHGYFEEHGEAAERLSFTRDPHFNARGHALIGDGVWSRLER